jgi:hypothetical protein
VQTAFSREGHEAVPIVVWSTVLGGLIAALAGFGTSALSNWLQRQRDRDAYERELERSRALEERTTRTAKRERLRDSYKTILLAAQEYQAAAHQLNYLMPDETDESRNTRLRSSLLHILAAMNEAVAAVTLENVGATVTASFEKLRAMFENVFCKATR